MIGFDALAILTIPTLQFIWAVKPQTSAKTESFGLLLACSTIWLIAAFQGYRPVNPKGRRHGIYLAIRCYLATAFVLFSLILILQQIGAIGGRAALLDLCGTPFMIAGARLIAPDGTREETGAPARGGAVVICYDSCPPHIEEALADTPGCKRVSGLYFLRPPTGPDRGLANAAVIEGLEPLRNFIGANNVADVIFLHHPGLEVISAGVREALLTDLLAFPCRIWLAIDLQGHVPQALKTNSGRMKLVPIVTDQLVTSENRAKRLFDIVCGGVALAAMLPLMILLALAVWAQGGGPVIFRQRRAGAYGSFFDVLKFRTMRKLPRESFAQAARDDPRVTRFGRFLRKTSLDELPQLLNVINGHMSLVGPRPHAPETTVEGTSFESAVKYYRLRHRVKPGMTGLAQIRGQRGETKQVSSLEQRIASDLEYIETWSLWLDCRILLQTLPLLFGQKNAY